MSDLQLSLLVLGIVVVAGVYAFNWLQERSHRKRTESAFSTPRHDVLMEQGAPRAQEVFDIAAPTVDPFPGEPEPEPVVTKPVPPPPATRTVRHAPEPDESPIDCAAILSAATAFGQAALDDIASATASLARPVRLYGSHTADGGWQPIHDDGADRWQHLKLAMQMVDRQGVASLDDIDEFIESAERLGESLGASASLPDAASSVAQALALDALCAEIDIAIGINVIARDGQPFQGTTIRALAEADGLRLQADGVFHSETSSGVTQFTLDNQGSEPFFPEAMRSLTTPGVTFLLDVPRASGGIAAFDRMLQVAQQFARSLDGMLVDDNSKPLDDAGIAATRRALAAVFATMESRGIAPGGPVALRLFS